ncbi:response regulator transcription factor [Paenibacillus sanfengchensis]|uniref:response regulator transcription factor n=1 Tax=Paenibacillus sanfengchensis TaxID=3119819 RepID=UPI002FE2C9AB
MENLVNIILLDDHPLVMEGLKNRLEEEPTFSVQAAFSDPLVLLDQIDRYEPDVLVMDVSMPKLDGFELASILKGKYGASLKLIMLSGYVYDEFYRKAYELGVNAYLSKQATYPQIINAIRQSMTGHVLMPEKLFAKLPVDPLTPMEQRVLALVARELTNKDIARELAVSQRTVEYHISSIIQKLEVKTRIGAVAKGYELGILGPVQL